MTAFSQSALLQALGWATLNSFWQVGLLWCLFSVVRRYGSVSPGLQFKLAVSGLAIGLVSFLLSLWFYLQPAASQLIAPPFLNVKDQAWLPSVLTAASIAYLILLLIPTARLFQNWRFLRKLRRSHLHKAPVQYRLFVQKVSSHLGLHRPVRVFLSGLVSSPVTIGFWKPLILLPIASFNHLTVRQAEAILLHELAHIRRFDFLINIGITVTQTLLYFNPFVRLFVQVAENSREASCDNLVLQFDYDRVAYASALLQLEQSATPNFSLAMGATGKNQFLSRIHSILGMQVQQPAIKLHHFTGLLASLLCVFALHSVFISGKNHSRFEPINMFAQFANPFQMTEEENSREWEMPENRMPAAVSKSRVAVAKKAARSEAVPEVPEPPAEWAPEPPEVANYIHVAEKEAALTKLSADEQEKVAAVIEGTKTVLSAYEWKQLEADIADGLNESEKSLVRQQFQKELEDINWDRMQENMAQNYNAADMEKVSQYLQAAQNRLKTDSLIRVYSALLSQLDLANSAVEMAPVPDLSIEQIERLKADLRQVRDSLINAQKRPLIKL